MSSSAIHKAFFGISQTVSSNLQVLDEKNILYVGGNSVCVTNTEDKSQRFIPGSLEGLGFTAISISSNKRFVACCDKSERPVIHIFDMRTLRKRKNLQFPETASNEFVSVCFSGDCTKVAAVTGGPDWSLVVWDWSKAKTIASTSLLSSPSQHISPLRGDSHHVQVSFSLTDDSMICVSCRSDIKFFRLFEDAVRELPSTAIPNHQPDSSSSDEETKVNQRNNAITCHQWIKDPPDHLVAGTSGGDLWLFGDGEFISFLSVSPGPSLPILSLSASSAHLAVGSTNGNFAIFSLEDVRNVDPASYYSNLSSSSVEDLNGDGLHEGDITNISFSFKEDQLYLSTSTQQLLSCEVMSPNNITPILHPFHSPSPIQGLSVCSRKPLLASISSTDMTLRLWNYQEKSLVLCHTFTDDPVSVSLHPSGHHIAIGFSDKFRIFHMLSDDLVMYQEFPIKGATECEFSTGGHLIALMNGNIINLFDFYSGEKLGDLRGHNGRVKSLIWQNRDEYLLSCGHDGAVYTWSVHHMKRVGEFVQKGTLFNSLVCSDDTAVVASSDMHIKTLTTPSLPSAYEYETGIPLTHLSLVPGKHLLISAIETHGQVPSNLRVYQFPLSGDYSELSCMSSPITKIVISPDESVAIVSDETGGICILELRDRLGQTVSKIPTLAWSDEVLVSLNDLDEKKQLMVELEGKVGDLKISNEYQLKLKEMNYGEKMKEVSERFLQDIEQQKTKLDLLKEEKTDIELEYEEKLKGMEEKHRNELQDSEHTFQQQIMSEVERYQELLHEKNSQENRFDDQRGSVLQAHKQYKDELVKEFVGKLEEEIQFREQLQDEEEEFTKECDEFQNQLEDDIDYEVLEMRKSYEDKIAKAREMNLNYKGENGIIRKKFVVFQRDIDEFNEEMKTLGEREKELHLQIKSLDQEIGSHKREIKLRDSSIGEKEKKIYELKKRNQELEKFKFVLDHKIKELKNQIEPREVEISQMKSQIDEMDDELEKYHRSNASLDVVIGEMRQKIFDANQELNERRRDKISQEGFINNFKADLQVAATYIQNPTRLVNEMDRLLIEYSKGFEMNKTQEKVNEEEEDGEEKKEDTSSNLMDPDIEEEFKRQKDHLEGAILSMKKKLQHDAVQFKQDENRLIEQNLGLIREINDQRETNKSVKGNLQVQLGILQRISREQAAREKRMGKKGKSSKSLRSSSVPPPEKTYSSRGELVEDGEVLLGELELNKQRISHLREIVNVLETKIVNQRTFGSKEVLPPVERIEG